MAAKFGLEQIVNEQHVQVKILSKNTAIVRDVNRMGANKSEERTKIVCIILEWAENTLFK